MNIPFQFSFFLRLYSAENHLFEQHIKVILFKTEGRIQFSVKYEAHIKTLTLKIIRATNLEAKDFGGTSDPYVKVTLLPDKKATLTTRTKHKNCNPTWNESFAFEGFSGLTWKFESL